MLSIVSLLVVLVLSMVVVRIGSVALRLTGMSDASARFQARSAFTGAGFTTAESEQVVSHPLRRKIIALLMLGGNVGITAASSTVILSFLGLQTQLEPGRVVVLVLGLVAIFWFASSQTMDRLLCGVISRGLSRYTSLETRDFTGLLHLGHDYHVAELQLRAEDWLVGQTPERARLAEEGVQVLAVTLPGGEFVGLPPRDFRFEAGQNLVLYGKAEKVDELDCRCASDESLPKAGP
ncbi:MAG: hypothetical protein MI919_05845 [Holophagales bacterium]|nr:hypothetical protein [Holophagales bacterium]